MNKWINKNAEFTYNTLELSAGRNFSNLGCTKPDNDNDINNG